MIYRHQTNLDALPGSRNTIGVNVLGFQVAASSGFVLNQTFRQHGYLQAAIRGFRSILLILSGVEM